MKWIGHLCRISFNGKRNGLCFWREKTLCSEKKYLVKIVCHLKYTKSAVINRKNSCNVILRYANVVAVFKCSSDSRGFHKLLIVHITIHLLLQATLPGNTSDAGKSHHYRKEEQAGYLGGGALDSTVSRIKANFIFPCYSTGMQLFLI